MDGEIGTSNTNVSLRIIHSVALIVEESLFWE